MTVMSEEATRLDRLCEMRNADTSRHDGWDKGVIFLFDVDAHSLHSPVYILNNSTNSIHTTRQF